MHTPHQTPLPLRTRLLDQVRDTIHRKHYSLRTEQSYAHWIKRYIFFHGKRHPSEMGATQVTAFLNHLATDGHVAASTQNQALAALLFLYREVLEIKLPWLDGLTCAKRPQRLPTVLTQTEVKTLLTTLEGIKWLMVTLLYGTGMRLGECLGLRVKDIDFEGQKIMVRDGKGGKDRITLLPRRVIDPLLVHLERVKQLHDGDLAVGLGEVALPFALARKHPKAGYEWGWQFVFPSKTICTNPYTGRQTRYHVHEKTLQRTVQAAARLARINKPVSCHCFRHSFATHLLETGVDIRTIQELMGHKDVTTTMIYTHVMSKPDKMVQSPADYEESWPTPHR